MPTRKAPYFLFFTNFSLRWGIYEIGDGLWSKIWKKLLFDIMKVLKTKTRENLIKLQKSPSHHQKLFFQIIVFLWGAKMLSIA